MALPGIGGWTYIFFKAIGLCLLSQHNPAETGHAARSFGWRGCNPKEIWQMTAEMLATQAEWLPQFAAEMPAARTRLEQAERNGTRMLTREYQGAAHWHTRTVEPLARDEVEARANADGADKGRMSKNWHSMHMEIRPYKPHSGSWKGCFLKEDNHQTRSWR